jgi:hypothetical protein
MANRFISASGSNTSPFDTWAKAATSTTTALADCIAQMTTGDSLWIDKTFVLSNASSQTMTFPGTDPLPNFIYSATNTGSAPVAADIAAGATITTTGSSSQTWNGAFYIYGVTVNVASGAAGSIGFTAGSVVGSQYWDNCSVHMKSTSGSSTINVATYSGGNKVTFNNTPMEFNTATSALNTASAGLFIWQNTPNALIAGTIPTALVNASGRYIFDGNDMSAITSGSKFINPGANPFGISMLVRNCKISGSGAVFQTLATGATRGFFVDAVACDSSGSTAAQVRRRYEGNLDVSTTVYNNASDGTTAHSWTVVTTANCTRAFPFDCFEIDHWAAAGTYASSFVYLTSADATLTNADVWVDVEYLGSGASPVASVVTSAPATVITTGSSLAASSPAWAHGSLGHDYQIAIPSFTTALAGYVRIRIKVAKASLTLNIDPAITIA